ncbi:MULTISPECIES: hypothetical protein [unclassified Tardiphaga]|uniref:hypothetical protein n=1 Tax=unclassified Tardiphaga TaxID=2631404 RepID=UPI0019BD303E|nr:MULTISPECIES: hypothetical protein [unclassified Tardiphaga]MBC7584241.1 follicular epithelium yolk protein subunit [Tardiphaga sp.]
MGIEIHVITGLDGQSASVRASGSVQHIITDAERNTFGINDAALKNAVARYFGQAPDDAFLHSDTPWGDLYRTYGWSQVQTVLTVASATVTGITSDPVIVAQNVLRNDSKVPGTFSASASESVSDTTSNTWSSSDSIQVSEKFSYEVSFLGTGGKGETSLAYTHSWGESKTESKQVTVGSTQGVTVTLAPGQAVNAQITASRGVMKVRIVYNATLTGLVAINYGNRYKGHHFWGLPLSGAMAAAGLSINKTFTEDIEIGFYANDQVILTDPVSQQVMSLHHGAAMPGIGGVPTERKALTFERIGD